MDDPNSRNGQGFFDDDSGPDKNFENRFFFHSPFREHFDVFQPFKEIIQSFFSDDHFGQHFGHLEERTPSDFDNNTNPRDKMLKNEDTMDEHKPFWFENFSLIPKRPQMDTDLDNKISSEGFEAVLLNPSREMQRHEPESRSFFKSFTSRTIRTADGKVKEERTVKDSSGKEEKTVRRIFGDQSHTVTTLKHPDGVEEIQENLINLDEGTIADFNEKWQRKQEQQSILHSTPPSNDPGFMHIFKKFFGYGPNER